MTIIKVLQISDNSGELLKSRINFHLISPTVGDSFDERTITITGQFVSNKLGFTQDKQDARIKPGQKGQKSILLFLNRVKNFILRKFCKPQTLYVAFNCNGPLARIPADKPLPSNPQNGTDLQKGGFSIRLGTLGLSREFSIHISAQYEDGPSIKLCTISAVQTAFQSNYKPSINPIMVTSLGRSGSTLVMKLLMNHPDIIATQIYPYEVRITSYWMRMLSVLSSPKLPGDTNAGDLFGKSNTIGPNPFAEKGFVRSESLQKWLNQDYVEKLAVFCQSNIEDYYKQIAREQNREQTKYFAEKIPPSKSQALLWDLYPQAREIILVRDFRDMACSVFAFEKKRGFAGFGKKANESDIQYIQGLRQTIKQLQQNWLDRKDQAYLVRYEDFIAQPERTTKGVMDYLGLACSSSDIAKIITAANENAKELNKHKTSDSVESSIGRWKQDLNSDLKQACQDSFGDISEYFGYTDK
jgi:hypothetical protein